MAELRGFEWRYLWQQSQGIKPLLSFRPHADTVEAIAWSRDGRLAVTVGDEQIVRVWQTDSWRAVTSLSASSANSGFRGHNSLAFSPDGKWLAHAGKSRLVVWETRDWTEAASLDEDAFPNLFSRPVKFSARGDRLAAATIGGIDFWEPGTWERKCYPGDQLLPKR
jgi:WD40 repeat protein